MGERRGRVVVGVADTPSGLRALRWAVDEARRRGTALCAVRSWRFNVAWEGADVTRWRDELAAEATGTVLATFVTAVGGVPADLGIDLVVTEGAAGPVLVDRVGEDDVLVVGTSSGRWWWNPFGVGRYCLRHADCPVVVVPAPSFGRRARALARQLRRDADDYAAIWAAQPPTGP
jgi:nucleotide-binding universal stress UspA family protein